MGSMGKVADSGLSGEALAKPETRDAEPVLAISPAQGMLHTVAREPYAEESASPVYLHPCFSEPT